MMARIIHEAESSQFYAPLSSNAGTAVTSPRPSPAPPAPWRARSKPALLVAFTESGLDRRGTPPRPDPTVPILAFSPNETTRRRLALYWGVVPCPIEPLHDADSMVERANAFVLANGLGSPGDKIVAVFGAPIGVSGTTNSVRVKVLE